MNMLTVSWCNDLKNCVPFYVMLNGKEIGIIKRGESIQSELSNGQFNLYLVPKAPRLFGWKAVQITAVQTSPGASQIELSVIYSNKSISSSQLHINSSHNISVISEELCKKY